MFNLSSKHYDFAKWMVQIAFPAFATFYLTLGQLWGLPASDKVVATLAALATFVGLILGINSRQYNADLEVADEQALRHLNDLARRYNRLADAIDLHKRTVTETLDHDAQQEADVELWKQCTHRE